MTKFMRFALAVLATALLPLPCLADALYTYSGTHFTNVYGSLYSTSDLITGEFTVSSPLADNLSTVAITPVSFNFSDGVQTIASSSIPLPGATFIVSTDASGNISQWLIDLHDASGLDFSEISSTTFGTTQDSADFQTQSSPGAAYITQDQGNAYSRGTWTESTVTPEPASLILSLTGLAATGLQFVRRRFA